MGHREAGETPAAPDVVGDLSHANIRDQVDRILGHREFQATEKMRAFLRFVVEGERGESRAQGRGSR